MINSTNNITKKSLSPYISDERLKNIHILDTVDSTNKMLKNISSTKASGHVIIANHQTAGQGRLGRSFVSPDNSGIYLSYMHRFNSSSVPLFITSYAAVAVAKAIYRTIGIYPSTKWVNDILINNKKVGGILTESIINPGYIDIIVGIGLNISTKLESFPSNLRNKASSIEHELEQEINKNLLVSLLIDELDKLMSRYDDIHDEYLDFYRRLDITSGKRIIYTPVHDNHNESYKGEAISINDDFSLQIRLDDNSIISASSGEIVFEDFYKQS